MPAFVFSLQASNREMGTGSAHSKTDEGHAQRGRSQHLCSNFAATSQQPLQKKNQTVTDDETHA
jgi:hypothetical protein